MASDDHPPPLRVCITDESGRPLRRPGLARWLAAVAPLGARGELAVALVSDSAMRRLNRRFAGVNHVTDVLSFPAVESRRHRFGSTRHLGDVVIATGVAARQARAFGHSLATELRVLALHGLLHLLGYDHTADAGGMARVEQRLRRKGGLEERLIDRAGKAGRAGAAGSALVRPASRRSGGGGRSRSAKP